MPVKQDPQRAREIGGRIAQARQEAGGMTQRELGELIGVSERSIIAYEKGDVIPFRFFAKLEEATGKPASWLLHGEESPEFREKELLEELRANQETILEELRAIRSALDGRPARRKARA